MHASGNPPGSRQILPGVRSRDRLVLSCSDPPDCWPFAVRLLFGLCLWYASCCSTGQEEWGKDRIGQKGLLCRASEPDSTPSHTAGGKGLGVGGSAACMTWHVGMVGCGMEIKKKKRRDILRQATERARALRKGPPGKRINKRRAKASEARVVKAGGVSEASMYAMGNSKSAGLWGARA